MVTNAYTPGKPEVRTKPPRRGPPPLSRALSPHLARLAKASGAVDPRILTQWPRFVGDELARTTMPLKLKKSGRRTVLCVAAANGSAAMALTYAQTEAIAAIRYELGLPSLTKFEIVQRGAQPRWRSGTDAPSPTAMEPSPAAPTETTLTGSLRRLRASLANRSEDGNAS